MKTEVELILLVAELAHTTTGSSSALLADDSLTIVFDGSLTTLVANRFVNDSCRLWCASYSTHIILQINFIAFY